MLRPSYVFPILLTRTMVLFMRDNRRISPTIYNQIKIQLIQPLIKLNKGINLVSSFQSGQAIVKQIRYHHFYLNRQLSNNNYIWYIFLVSHSFTSSSCVFESLLFHSPFDTNGKMNRSSFLNEAWYAPYWPVVAGYASVFHNECSLV
jgi:hypothetical protein